MAVSRQYQRTQQTGALAVLFVLLAVLTVVIVLLVAVVIPDSVSMIDSVRDAGSTAKTN